MAVDTIYTGTSLYNILASNNTVDISYSAPNVIVTVPNSRITGPGTPGVRIDGFDMTTNRVYRLSVTGRTITPGISPNLWAAKDVNSRNLLSPVPSLTDSEIEITGEFIFPDSLHASSCFVGVLIHNANPGDSFMISRIQLQLLIGDYIDPFGIVKNQPTFQSVQVVSDLIINGISIGAVNTMLAGIIATDASMISDIASIIISTASIISDIGVLSSDQVEFTSDIAELVATDINANLWISGLWTTDSSLSSDLTETRTLVSDTSLSAASDIQILLRRIYQYSSDIHAIQTTDTAMIDDLIGLSTTDISLNSELLVLFAGQTAIILELGAFTATDISLQSDIVALQTTDTYITARNVSVHSDIIALQTTDAAIFAGLTSDISSLTATDLHIENLILSIWATDTAISSDLEALQATDIAISSDIIALLTTDIYIISQIGGSTNNSDIAALQTTEAFIGSEIVAITATDIAINSELVILQTTDVYILSVINSVSSDIIGLKVSDTAFQSTLSMFQAEISAIWSSESAMSSLINAVGSDLSAIWTTEAAINSNISVLTTAISEIWTSEAAISVQIASFTNSDHKVSSDLIAIFTTDTSTYSDIVAIWTTETYISLNIGIAASNQLFATDAAITSDLAAIRTSEIPMVSDMAIILTTDAVLNAIISTYNSDLATVASITNIPTYNSEVTYSTGDMVYYNGRVFQATGMTVGVSPIDYLFYDNFTGFCNDTPLNNGLYGYTNNNNFTGTFLTNNVAVATSGLFAAASSSTTQCLAVDPGVVDVTIEITYINMPSYLSANPWFCLKTPSNGVLTFVAGNIANDTGNPTTHFAIGGGGTGSLTGGASATAAIISGSYTPPVTSDTLRITRTASTVALQVRHNGSFGGTGLITMTGATFTSADTSIQMGIGSGGSYIIPFIAMYANVTSEDAKLWSLVQQPQSRQHVTANALTLHARHGRFFWNTGAVAGNSGTSIMTWTNRYITPQSSIRLRVNQCGRNSVVNNSGLTVSLVAQGQGKAKLQINNGGSTSITSLLGIVFYIDYPIALT